MFVDFWGSVNHIKSMKKASGNVLVNKSSVGTPCIAGGGWGYGYAISSESPDRIVGRVIGIIEAIGLTEKQEESVKGLIRSAVWDVFQDAVCITDKRHSEIRMEYFKQKRENPGVPMSAI